MGTTRAPGGAASLAVGHQRRPAGHRRSIAPRPGRGCVATRSTSRIRASRDRAGRSHGQYDEQDSLSYRIAYFYCQQAERLYAALVATPREDLRVKTARASELASIGMLLERHGPRRRGAGRRTDWQCSRATIDEDALASDVRTVSHHVPTSHYTRAALGYYRQALKLLPDDSVLRCHEASAEFAVSGDVRLMRALETEAASRWNLAESYRARGPATPRQRRHPARAAAAGPAGSTRHPDRRCGTPRARGGVLRPRPLRVPGDAEARSDQLRGAEPLRPRLLGMAPWRGERDPAGGPRTGARREGGVERPEGDRVIKAKSAAREATPARVLRRRGPIRP